MGLTYRSTGRGAATDGGHAPQGAREVALAGNPNVGKSTVFNALTGMDQHTGNWPGKTVASARGYCPTAGGGYILVDIPGTYSLMAHSAEEEVARDYLCFGGASAVAVVCDATCLERNLNLVLQTAEIGIPTVVCINLMDEAKRKHIAIDTQALSRRLGLPVVAVTARRRKSLDRLTAALDEVIAHPVPPAVTVDYGEAVEAAIARLVPPLTRCCSGLPAARWLALRLLDPDAGLMRQIEARYGTPDEALAAALEEARQMLAAAGLAGDALRDHLVTCLVSAAAALCDGTVTRETAGYAASDRRIDRIVTGRLWGYPLMLLMLLLVFWLTIEGANLPSAWLGWLADRGEAGLTALFRLLHAPPWLYGALVQGVYRVLTWVISVMLPPMAIFFPLFTLLEDSGYLPRIAYNLDRPFRACRACGKQALTMCMGFGCNAAGVVGCRIIDSPRERLLAILTNSLVPCNGRFPTLITLLTLFFVGTAGRGGWMAALLLTGVILLGVAATFGLTRLLAATVLRGVPSSFTLELPPYRRPQVMRVLVRSVTDRTLFVLGRAAAVAAPAGLLIWLMANLTVGGTTLLALCAGALDPFARLMGLDGVILMAFILGFPANEIVLPIILMAYLAAGSPVEMTDLAAVREVLIQHGWTARTALCTVLFSLFHWPCSTTLLTVYRETGSRKWTALAAALPTALGVLLCLAVTLVTGG